MNVEVDDNHVAVCYGYPPAAVYKQSVYTNIGKAGIGTKVDVPEQTILSLREGALATRPVRAGEHGTEVPRGPGVHGSGGGEGNWVGERGGGSGEGNISCSVIC